MNKNPLLDSEALGQSFWLDDPRRNALDNGELQNLLTMNDLTRTSLPLRQQIR